jgi:hypothetical protein
VVAVLARRGIDADAPMVRSGSLILPGPERQEWMLRELSCACAAADAYEWEGMIRRSLASMIGEVAPKQLRKRRKRRGKEGSTGDAEVPRVARGETFELAELRLQIFSDDYLTTLAGSNLIAAPVGEGLRAILVRDIGGAAEITVSRSEASQWGRSDEELLRIGRANAVAADVHSIEFQTVSAGGALFEVGVSNGFYLGACILGILAEEAGEGAAGDCLVCFLSWHHVILHSVVESSRRETVLAMRELIGTIDASIEVT